MIRISVTMLESFRRVLQTEYAAENELIDSIKGLFTPNLKMQAGTAWHKLMESNVTDLSHLGRIDVGRFSFDGPAIRRGHAALGPGVHEVKATKAFATSLGEATVVAQADHVNGRIITDIKAKFSPMDARDYESSLQWRFYLHVHEAMCFRYMLFDFTDPKDGYCELKDLLTFRFWPYDGMEQECHEWVEQFVQWAADKGLLGYLNREGQTLAA